MSTNPRKGFTLVELIVVIGIIAILAGVLIASLSGSSDSARAARCLSNMKNLASAVQTYGSAEGYYPVAGNMTYLSISESRGTAKKTYTDLPGWISRDTQGRKTSASYSNPAAISLYSEDDEASLFALTNGALWQYVSGNRSTYVCPEHVRKRGSRTRPVWSYLMNAYFGWDGAGFARIAPSKRVKYGSLAKADKILLFSEVPFAGFNTWQPDGEGGTTDTDAILQYSESGLASGDKGKAEGGGGNEELGVNHIVQKRNAFAHVAFADGHVEKLRVKMTDGKPDTTQMGELGGWLAVGLDVENSNSTYKKIDNN